MVHSTGEERAVHLTREAIELVDAGHREVCAILTSLSCHISRLLWFSLAF